MTRNLGDWTGKMATDPQESAETPFGEVNAADANYIENHITLRLSRVLQLQRQGSDSG